MSGKMFNFLNDVGNYETRKIARFESGRMVIDTARVSDGNKPYETAVSHQNYNGGKWVIVEAYSAREEAQSGHDKWVKTMTAETLPAELRDCQNAEISQLLSGEDLIFPFVSK